MDKVKIIIEVPEEGGQLAHALQAATSLRLSDHQDCVYSIGGRSFWAKRNKASISVRQLEEPKAE
jgi:hypothetical protein